MGSKAYKNLDDAIKYHFPYKEYEDLINDVCSYIKKRIGKYLDITKTFYVEDDYIDVNWRFLYSKHYSKTYYRECSKYSIRVHLFKGDINEPDYMGYFLLRPIPVLFALSKIVLKPIKGFYNLEESYLMTNIVEINIMDIDFSVKINAFQLLVQDTVVGVCADACINMVAYYLSNKFPRDFPNYLPEKLFPIHLYSRAIPSYGLTTYEMSEILLNAGYNSYIQEFTNNKEDFIGFIDSQIESALPVILSYEQHVSIIVGHTNSKSLPKQYIIYDDSGVHLKTIGFNNDPLFSGLLDLGKIEWNKRVFTISFDFDKVFLRHEYVDKMLKELGLKPNDFERKLLIDYRTLVSQLKDKNVDYYSRSQNKPHYVWWLEGNSKVGLVIDASCHKYDTKYSIIAFVKNNNKGDIRLLYKT
ncbi:hypothetical protein MBAV_003248 [Candidatus Magnetobacterium bavaricum]|uniref:Uncharacterized protein n=1 Tax=Candidatus Magnetobacterium bavaricum TaxID=29290 RepID=A0A0F3GRI2_9BACT|nr:hypothetical protein MBAV_003248 [Candidatus Magnetobacterium bavaricum]